MSKHGWALVLGTAMIIAGAVLFVVFRAVETPVVGLRQAGLVIAVLGVLEVGATGWTMLRSRQPHA